MRMLVYTSLLIFLIPLQGLVGDYFPIGDIKPDFGFLAIYFTGLLFGNVRGALAGIGIGLISDLLSGGMTLVQMETGLIIGFSAGLIRTALLNLRWFSNLVILFVFSLFYSYLIFTLLDFTSREAVLRYPWRDLIIPKGVYDAFLGSFVFWMLMKWSKFKNIFEETDDVDGLFFSSSRKS
jgi:rod shape-determining protein MreD